MYVYVIYRMYSYAATRFHKDICIRYYFYLKIALHDTEKT